MHWNNQVVKRSSRAMFIATWMVFLSISTLVALVLVGTMLLLPKPTDDIPLAQGLQAGTSPPRLRDSLSNMITVLPLVIAIHLPIWMLCKRWGIRQTTYIALLSLISSGGGLLLSGSPLGNQVIWDMIIRFHLKRQDRYLDLTIDLLRVGFAIVIGISIGFLLGWLLRFFARRQTAHA